MSEEEGQGGSKCQIPLGSEDGGQIYQSKQPRGTECFTCRCGLSHCHICQCCSIPFQLLTIQNANNLKNSGSYKMLSCSRAQILKRTMKQSKTFCSTRPFVQLVQWKQSQIRSYFFILDQTKFLSFISRNALIFKGNLLCSFSIV